MRWGKRERCKGGEEGRERQKCVREGERRESVCVRGGQGEKSGG